MAFTLHEKNNISWLESDLIPYPHMFTRKLGSVGDFPFESNNVSDWHNPERQAAVYDIWQRIAVAGGFGEKGFCMHHQVHGNDLKYVTGENCQVPPLAAKPENYDGCYTDRREVPLCVFTADCVPVLLCDPEAGVIAAAHSGWRSTVKDMMGSAVAKLVSLGANPENIRAAIGPAISKCCFEVGPEVGEAIEALLGSEDAEGICVPEPGVPGKFLADIKETNRRRLLQLGVKAENIDVSDVCTMCSQDEYWSHRATGGKRGTMANIIMLPKEENHE